MEQWRLQNLLVVGKYGPRVKKDGVVKVALCCALSKPCLQESICWTCRLLVNKPESGNFPLLNNLISNE
eukprot:1146805-Pelagomonas_calceolata.AAC.7